MGTFNTAIQRIKSAGKPLSQLEATLTRQTEETDRILKLNRQTSGSILALEEGLKKAHKRANPPRPLPLSKIG